MQTPEERMQTIIESITDDDHRTVLELVLAAHRIHQRICASPAEFAKQAQAFEKIVEEYERNRQQGIDA
jgi:hypothetical protein